MTWVHTTAPVIWGEGDNKNKKLVCNIAKLH